MDTEQTLAHLPRLLPRARPPRAARRPAGPAAGRPGALHHLRHAPADPVPDRPPAPARRPPGRRPALPAHHRPGRGRRPHPPDRLRDARLLVAGRLRHPAEPALGPRAAGRRLRPRSGPAARHRLRRRRPRRARARTPTALRTWQELGVPVEPLGGDNWWSNGPTGPCGPDSEIFVWTGDGPPHGTPSSDPRWVEVWNHVTMRYRRHDDGTLHPLAARQRRHRDGPGTAGDGPSGQGLGLRHRPLRTVAADRAPAVGRSMCTAERRIVVDHLRSAAVLVGDGVRPAATGHGYVLRRLVRRVLTLLWRDDPSRTLGDLPVPLGRGHPAPLRPAAGPRRAAVREVLLDEERRFGALLERGRRVLVAAQVRRAAGRGATTPICTTPTACRATW